AGRRPRRRVRHAGVRLRLRAGRGTSPLPRPARRRAIPPRGHRGLPRAVGVSARQPVLRVAGLSGGYSKAPILRDMSLEVGAGEIVALFGANGAGKTALLR